MNTSYNIFVVGGAGVGKTSFIHALDSGNYKKGYITYSATTYNVYDVSQTDENELKAATEDETRLGFLLIVDETRRNETTKYAFAKMRELEKRYKLSSAVYNVIYTKSGIDLPNHFGTFGGRGKKSPVWGSSSKQIVSVLKTLVDNVKMEFKLAI